MPLLPKRDPDQPVIPMLTRRGSWSSRDLGRLVGRGLGVRIRSVEGRKGRIGVSVARRVWRLGRERSWGGRRRTVMSVVLDLHGHFVVCPDESRGV